MSGKYYPSTLGLLSQGAFRHKYGETSRMEFTELSYLRAREMSRHFGLTLEDIFHCSPKLWAVHMDYISILDPSSAAIFSIQINLVAGTIARFAFKRPELKPLVRKILDFDILASFMITELGHGNDAKSLETTATLQEDGSFILDSPTPGSKKFMPQSIPIINTPRMGVVFARLIVDSQDRGVRPFLVPLTDGQNMCKGIKSQLLPLIGCGRTFDHSVTSFNHVSLPASALLGDLGEPTNPRDNFLSVISQVGVGTLALSLYMIPYLKCAAFIVGKFSQQRTVQLAMSGDRAPIISFRTQHMPILYALAEVSVMEALVEWATFQFKNPRLDPRSRHGMAVIVKALFTHHTQPSLAGLIERSGAQGTFPHNQMTELEGYIRTISIVEGDILVLCIRLATELLIGRYQLPHSTMPTCLLARHEAGFIAELQKVGQRIVKGQGHRGEEHNALILPHCRNMVIAIGRRMAYEAAVKSGVHPDLLALYEAGAVKADTSWYVEHAGLSRSAQREMERKALDAVLPRLDELLEDLRIEPYCTAPILSASRHQGLMDAVPEFSGNAEWSILGDEQFGHRSKL